MEHKKTIDTTAAALGGKVLNVRGAYLFMPTEGESVFLGLTEAIAVTKLMDMYEWAMQPIVDELIKIGI